jgi:hypothetical protein
MVGRCSVSQVRSDNYKDYNINVVFCQVLIIICYFKTISGIELEVGAQ